MCTRQNTAPPWTIDTRAFRRVDRQIRRRHPFSFWASHVSHSFNTPNKWRNPPSKDTSWKFPEPRPLICPFRRNLSSVSHPNRPFLLPVFFISSASLTFPDHLLPSYVFCLKFPLLFFFPLLPSFPPLTLPLSTLAVHMSLLSPPSSLFPYNFFSSVIPPTFHLTLAFLLQRSKSNSREMNIRFNTSVRPSARTPLSLFEFS
jgi:hypothetical protein